MPGGCKGNRVKDTRFRASGRGAEGNNRDSAPNPNEGMPEDALLRCDECDKQVLEERHNEQLAVLTQAHKMEMDRQMESMSAQSNARLSETQSVHMSALQATQADAAKGFQEQSDMLKAQMAGIERKSLDDILAASTREGSWKQKARGASQCAVRVGTEAVDTVKNELQGLRVTTATTLSEYKAHLEMMRSSVGNAIGMFAQQVLRPVVATHRSTSCWAVQVYDAQKYSQDLKNALKMVPQLTDCPNSCSTVCATGAGGCSYRSTACSRHAGVSDERTTLTAYSRILDDPRCCASCCDSCWSGVAPDLNQEENVTHFRGVASSCNVDRSHLCRNSWKTLRLTILG